MSAPIPQPTAEPPEAKRSLRQRIWAAALWLRQQSSGQGRRKLLMALVACAAGLPLLVGLGLWLITGQRHVTYRPTVAEARRAFDAHDDERARYVALALANSPKLPPAERFWPPLILGRLAARQAEQLSGNDQLRQYALSARYFSQASRRGLPEAEQAACTFEWGKSLYSSGQIAESVRILKQAAGQPNEHLDEVRLLLAQAMCDLPEPTYTDALAQLTELLKSTGLSHLDRQTALLLAADVEFRLAHLTQALAWLDGLSRPEADKPETRLLRAQILVAQARQTAAGPAGRKPDQSPQDAWNAALAVVRKLAAEAAASDTTRAAAEYLVGICHAGLGQPRDAAEAWADVHHRHPFAPATLAARFELAELRHHEGNDDQAATLLREAARQLEDEETENPWLSVDAAKRRMLAMHQHLLEQRKFALAMELGGWFEALLGEDERVQLSAQTHEAWGRRLQEQADQLPPADAAGAHQRAREERIAAGDDYRRLAQLRFTTRQYSDLLWASAENYSAGQDYTEAATQWRAYLEVELRARRAEALLELGRALLALEEPEEALLSLDDCIELEQTSVASFEARRLAAEAYLELNDPAKAQAVLEQTLTSDVLKPVSQEWRQALIALARLLYQTGRLSEARVRLEEVVQRYPEAAFNTDARYLLATTCWKLALAARQAEAGGRQPTPPAQSKSPAASAEPASGKPAETKPQEAAQPVTVPPVDQLLATAGSQYAAVAAALARRQEENPLPAWDAALLRNSYFGQGAVLFQQGRYEQAVQAYLAVVNRYYESPVVLEAYTQIYACYRRLSKPAEARDALLLARAALAQLPADAAFAETTNHSRAQWGELFDALARL